MIHESEIREWLADFLNGYETLDDFEDWLVSTSWNAHLDSTEAAQDLAASIELALMEHSKGHLSDDALVKELESLRDQIPVDVTVTPDLITEQRRPSPRKFSASYARLSPTDLTNLIGKLVSTSSCQTTSIQ